MIKIEFYSLLRLMLQQEQLQLAAVEGETLSQLLLRVQRRVQTSFLHKLVDDRDELIPGTMILLNRRNVLHLNGLETVINDGDIIAFFPPGAGG